MKATRWSSIRYLPGENGIGTTVRTTATIIVGPDNNPF